MSTRCFIGVLCNDDSVRGVYCHSDGYPDGVGKMLREHYSSGKCAMELLGLGSLSCLKPRMWPEEHEYHTFDDPIPDVAIAYHRDRGEPWEPPQMYKNVEDAIRHAGRDCGAQWLYVWDGEQWNFHQASQWVY
jgi:hypothetical protein